MHLAVKKYWREPCDFFFWLMMVLEIGCHGARPPVSEKDEKSYVVHNDVLTDQAFGEGIESQSAFFGLGFMYDASSKVDLEYSVSRDQKIWSEYSSAQVTFFEEADKYHYVAKSRVLDKGAFFYRLRLKPGTSTDDSLSYLRVSLLEKAPREESINFFQNGTIESSNAGYRTELSGLGIVWREEWGARQDTACSGQHYPRKQTIHHTDTPNDDRLSSLARVRQIQAYHMDANNWCDIGYHFLIGKSGEILEGRPLELIGAHVGGANTGNIGISFVGSFSIIDASMAQKESAARLLSRQGCCKG